MIIYEVFLSCDRCGAESVSEGNVLCDRCLKSSLLRNIKELEENHHLSEDFKNKHIAEYKQRIQQIDLRQNII
jgi:hypothetical protein